MIDTHKRHLPLQAYLLALIILTALVVGGLSIYQQHLRKDRALAVAVQSLDLVAGLGADDITEALKSGQETAGGLAANPGLAALFAIPTPQGCALEFSGAGPFTEGRIDILNQAGKVLCSSKALPERAVHAGAGWLGAKTPGVIGPVDDGGHQSLVIVAPIQESGVVAVFVRVDSVPADLEARYGRSTPVRFNLLLKDGSSDVGAPIGQDAITRDAKVSSLGWTVRASEAESEALLYATDANRQMTLFIIIALLLIAALTQLIYLGIARPIRRLSSAVRTAMTGNGTIEPPTSGPHEVISLGQDFSHLTQNVAAELTQRQHAELEAKTSEARYRTMFEANPQPVWVHHAETGQLVAANTAMVERFGWSREELLSMPYQDFVSDKSADLKDAFGLSELVDRSGPWTLTTRDDAEISCLITSAPLQLPDAPGRIVVAEDITEQLHNERLLKRTQRMESLGQLAGGVAHDFNNLLAVMLNYADFAAKALKGPAEEDPQRWGQVLIDVREIGTAGHRAAVLTRQLLSFARGDALETGPVNIDTVAAGIENLLRRTLGEQVSLELSQQPDVWPVEANVGQLEQVIVNLAVNARDAMPDGGRLSIEISNVDVDDDYTATRPGRLPGRYVRLRVSDTGVGMDAEARDRAFEPFFTTKDRATGTGLGLATVYGVVQHAGGSIDIYSELGLGTTVSMFLPVMQGHAEPAPTAPATRAPNFGSETILLVEDDEALRTLAERILGGVGYRVVTAEDGPTGEMIAEERRGEIDLLLTDLVMPGMLGGELARRVTDADPNVKVLFMSGYAPQVLVNDGTLPFKTAMVDKPFSADLLLGKVRQAIDEQDASAGSWAANPGRDEIATGL